MKISQIVKYLEWETHIWYSHRLALFLFHKKENRMRNYLLQEILSWQLLI